MGTRNSTEYGVPGLRQGYRARAEQNAELPGTVLTRSGPAIADHPLPRSTTEMRSKVLAGART